MCPTASSCDDLSKHEMAAQEIAKQTGLSMAIRIPGKALSLVDVTTQ